MEGLGVLVGGDGGCEDVEEEVVVGESVVIVVGEGIVGVAMAVDVVYLDGVVGGGEYLSWTSLRRVRASDRSVAISGEVCLGLRHIRGRLSGRGNMRL